MSTRREKPGAPPAGEAPHPSGGDDRLLTSKDLFGDMVDAQAAPQPGAPGATRSAPIKVQVGELGAPRKSSPLASDGPKDMLPDDVAALLDAFSGPPEDSTPEPSAEVVPPSEPQAESVEAAEPDGGLLDELVDPSPPADWHVPPDATLPPASVEALFGSKPPAAFGTPDMPPPPEDRGGQRRPSDLEAALADLRNLQRPRLPRPAAPRPDAAREADVSPAARTATKFTAAAPTAKPVEAGGLDLAALAEEAFAAHGQAAAEAEAPVEELGAPAGEYGPYRLLERVAVGGMAEVFRAKRAGVEGFEKVVAVKRILSHLSDNKEFVDMFIDEAKMVSGLSHPNIVQIFDLGKIEKSYFIAMDYVHGRDLRSILKRAKERGLRIPLDISAHVVSKVSAALEYAHRKRDEAGRPMMIVHRDVSPQNILISFEGDVKLTDFGIAKAATKAHSTDRGALRGKLLYMSPEQAWGKALDKRSDVFSLGVVFYEMLTEQKPFLGSSEMSILETVRECRVAPPSTLNPRIPEKLERVVMKSLERDPELRYQDAGEMLRDLERVLHEWPPATSSALARFLEILFDETERGAHAPDAAVEHPPAHIPSSLEVELPEAASEPEAPPADAPRRDPMSIQKLLKRFGIK